jgi:hypothetical protein
MRIGWVVVFILTLVLFAILLSSPVNQITQTPQSHPDSARTLECVVVGGDGGGHEQPTETGSPCL